MKLTSLMDGHLGAYGLAVHEPAAVVSHTLTDIATSKNYVAKENLQDIVFVICR